MSIDSRKAFEIPLVSNVFVVFSGDWTFIVNGRKRSYVLHAKLQEEAIRWANAIQEVHKTLLQTMNTVLKTE